MSRTALDWIDLLAKALLWAAGLVLLFSAIAAVSIAGSDSSLPLIGDLQRENRGIITIFAVISGLTASGALAGLGAILKLMLVEPMAAAREGQASRAAPRKSSAKRKKPSTAADQAEPKKRKSESGKRSSKRGSKKRADRSESGKATDRKQARKGPAVKRKRPVPEARPEDEPDERPEAPDGGTDADAADDAGTDDRD